VYRRKSVVGLGTEFHRQDDGSVRTITLHQNGDAFGGSFPFATVDFGRGAAAAVTGFRASNGRTRGVWFQRVE
jgi:hypothetical protein